MLVNYCCLENNPTGKLRIMSTILKTATLLSVVISSLYLSGCNDDNDEINTVLPKKELNSSSMVADYAEDGDITLAEAEKQLKIMDKSEEIYQKVADTFGEEYISSIYFIRGNDFSVGVRLSSDVSYDMKTLILDDGTAVPITLTNKEKYNAQGIQDYILAMKPSINKVLNGVSSVGYEYDTNSIVIVMNEPNQLVRNLNSKVDLTSIIKDMNFDIRYEEAPLEDSALITRTVLAGGQMTGPGTCTAGFTGTVNGVRGFLTATHCSYYNAYVDNSSNSLAINKNNVVRKASTEHEISFIPTPEWPIYGGSFTNVNSFDSSSVLKINGEQDEFVLPGAAEPLGGTYVCHYGRLTGTSCGYVTARESNNTASNTLPNGGGCNSKYSSIPSVYNQSCAATFFKVQGKDLACASGDSGGPIYKRSSYTNDIRAYGIANSASSTGGQKGQCVSLRFSSLYYAYTDFDFKLKTEI